MVPLRTRAAPPKSGGWVTPFFEDKFGNFMVDVFAKGGAYLLGRKTYEIFASYWPSHNDPKAASRWH